MKKYFKTLQRVSIFGEMKFVKVGKEFRLEHELEVVADELINNLQ